MEHTDTHTTTQTPSLTSHPKIRFSGSSCIPAQRQTFCSHAPVLQLQNCLQADKEKPDCSLIIMMLKNHTATYWMQLKSDNTYTCACPTRKITIKSINNKRHFQTSHRQKQRTEMQCISWPLQGNHWFFILPSKNSVIWVNIWQEENVQSLHPSIFHTSLSRTGLWRPWSTGHKAGDTLGWDAR